ncbi:cupin domain-containing protein [Streptococcus henryi]|uniref:cupin domain-containing protein n=1 Tax=Streptococcus henryi TaxID=439219 RepID=UPI000379FB20|nr:cupin domain-containing protein [Streptococcus henryi]
MEFIFNEDIDCGLEKNGRVYLTGNLKKPQDTKHISTTNYEMGISRYNSFKAEQAHTHRFNQEYNYILQGEAKVFIFEEDREYHFKKGDMFYISPGMSYMVKCLSGTEILFTKVPGGNDKELFNIENNKVWINWTKEW